MSLTLPAYDLATDILPVSNAMIIWAGPALLLLAAWAVGPKLVGGVKSLFVRIFGRRA